MGNAQLSAAGRAGRSYFAAGTSNEPRSEQVGWLSEPACLYSTAGSLEPQAGSESQPHLASTKKPAPKDRLSQLKLDNTPPVPYAQRLKTFFS